MDDAPDSRGRLKIFLGYISGVGKSFRMLDEGRRRRERGQDVVVGAVQPRTDGPAAAALACLPCIAMPAMAGRPVMDVDAIIARQPAVCLVDGMAYDNPPGAAYAHRWQEIDALLAAGVSVIASVNLQFITERADAVERLTGRRAAETVPVRILLQADEIEIVDAPPMSNGAKPGTAREALSGLRELALRLAADVVDRQLETYMRAHGIESRWGTQERILVCVTPAIPAGAMIESGRRNADRFGGELIVAHVSQAGLAPEPERLLADNLRRAHEAGAEVAMLEGEDFVDAIMPFARARGITQLFVGHSIHRSWRERWRRGALGRLIRVAAEMDVRIFPH